MALDVTDERVASAAHRLNDGRWLFSGRQLYYAVCADVEAAPTRIASGEVGVGVLLILIGAITGQRILLAALGAAGLLLLIIGAVTHVQERRPAPTARVLAIGFDDFERRFLRGGHAYDGLVTEPAETSASPVGSSALVVCDRAETASVLVANRERIGQIGVTVAHGAMDVEPGRRVVALHDCDPAGCALVVELREQGMEVVDAGINPAEIAGLRVQVLEGAPARLPRDLSGHLDATQIDWLRAGRRLELATETPEQLVQRVRAALAS